MNIKVGDEYLDFEGEVNIVKRVKTPDTIDSAGDFSYAFELPLTSKNIKILKLGVNRTDKIIYNQIDATIELNGTPLYLGYIRVERITVYIECSFFSGNNNWFNALEGLLISDLDLSSYAVEPSNISPSPVVINSWTATEGITFPLVDLGLLKYAITKDVSDFIPMMYVKNVFTAIFQQNGFKIDGDLLQDARFNNSVAASIAVSSADTNFIISRNSYIGKGSQSINTTPQLVTFNIETYPYYDGSKNNFASNRYTADVDMNLAVTVELDLDASVLYTVELRRNGSVISTLIGTNDTISETFNSGNAVSVDAGQYLEVWMSIDSGTVNIEEGSIRVRVIGFQKIYPQFLFGSMTQSEFVYNIFTMFNVVASYDQFTKTITANLFKDISHKAEQDLSEYINDYEIDFTEVIGEVSKRNLFVYEATDDNDQTEYNDNNIIPWGGGSIEPNNEFVSGESERSVSFAAPWGYFNETFGGTLASLGYLSAEPGEEDGNASVISSVSDSGGDALFTTAADHGFDQGDYVWITETSNGQYVGLGVVSSAPSTTTFKLSDVPFEAGGPTVTGTVVRATVSTNESNKVFIGINVPNIATSQFMNGAVRYGSTNYTNIAYFYFLKTGIGKPIDEMRETLAFSNPAGYNQVTLLDKYYGENQKFLNDPVKIRANMNIPFKVFNDLDLARPVRIKTKDFDIKGFVSNNEGWVSSSSPCLVETIKLS